MTIKRILSILATEPEEWLNYHIGQQIHNDPHFKRIKKKLSGILPRMLVLLANVIKNSNPFEKRRVDNCTNRINLLFFANTKNQLASLEPCITALIQSNESLLLVTERKYANGNISFSNSVFVKFSAKVHASAAAIFVLRAIALIRRLSSIEKTLVSNYLNQFLESYWYLPYFISIFENLQPKCAITSNDHNTANRCFIAAARSLGVKTVYIQHASVSDLFPALNFDYALLDGKAALGRYLQCENNRPKLLALPKKTTIFLSGQQKALSKSRDEANKAIGLALNSFDDIISAVTLIRMLIECGYEVCLRWHPGQRTEEVSRLRREVANIENLILSNPLYESVEKFFGKISHLIAGNSSIHLEAALSHVIPIYFELNKQGHHDYYGYCASGISVLANSLQEVREALEKSFESSERRTLALQHFSSTYGTAWESKEGILAGEILKLVLSDQWGEERSPSQHFNDLGIETLIIGR